MTLKARKYPEQQGLLQACNKCHKAPIRGNKDKTLKCGPGKMAWGGGLTTELSGSVNALFQEIYDRQLQLSPPRPPTPALH